MTFALQDTLMRIRPNGPNFQKFLSLYDAKVKLLDGECQSSALPVSSNHFCTSGAGKTERNERAIYCHCRGLIGRGRLA
jgi:hypothetical protein